MMVQCNLMLGSHVSYDLNLVLEEKKDISNFPGLVINSTLILINTTYFTPTSFLFTLGLPV